MILHSLDSSSFIRDISVHIIHLDGLGESISRAVDVALVQFLGQAHLYDDEHKNPDTKMNSKRKHITAYSF